METAANDQPGLFEATETPVRLAAGQTTQPSPPAIEQDEAERERWEAMASDLEATGRYRVLRRFEERLDEPPAPTVGVLKGVYLDVETTGLMPSDRIVELALLAFHYDAEGNVVHVSEAFDQLEDPGRKIPADVVSLTGITDEMVRGKSIAEADVARIMGDVDLVIAHNAGFDRQFVEARFPYFSEVAWACSANDVDWLAGGHRSRKLENLALAKGYFYQAHRAIYDCHVGLGLLRLPVGELGPPALIDLLGRSATDTARLWAESSPFDKKDDLKARRYRWSAQAKSWWRDLPAEELEAEAEWLAEHVYPRRRPLPYVLITARTRYSPRLPEAPPPYADRV